MNIGDYGEISFTLRKKRKVPIDTPLYSCGASLQVTDAYDHQAGRYANPGQSAWLVHPKHGEFNRINFNL